ncbi:PPE family protein [Candidatus Mycobacterium wuenschmannii]|uniref:PPE family protein n=1 Tax=Candidatus Mycobacterium wuenschmannii TaxID=3027808 RepID=A0ABY8W150_9MYCO|nr:PPE family protein [Candidatus Mycobacterium wuenschmannii]WIM88945.1 PPE family protein [Candidatus Mycobacterium wuenschmannii]
MTAALDFGAFPPDVNSAKMYAGPGSASMLAAASTWNGLASELRSQAANYSAIVANLTGEGWQGPASTAMAGAAAPYTAWMHTTAAQAEQTAGQATAAAAAYEAAYGMTVPPPVIAANRAQLAALVATNVLGQNGPAIAATEAHYGQMWAQDAAAMYGYAAQSSSATKVPAFATAPQTTAPGALAGQAAATTQATGSSAQAALSQLTSSVPGTLQGMSSPATSSTSMLGELEGLLSGGSSGNSQLDGFWNAWGPNANVWNTITSTGAINPLQAAQIVTSASFLGPGTMAGSEGLSQLSPLGGMAAGLGSGTPAISGVTGLGAAAPSMSAGVGQAASIGQLSVPPGWTSAPPAAMPSAGSALGSTPLAAPAEVAAGVPGVAPTGAGVGARAGATGGIMDTRFLARPPMVPSWAAVG